MADSKRALSSALEERLGRAALLAEDGIRLIPSTANPGPLGLYGFALTTCLLQGCFTTIISNEPANKGLVYGFGFFFGGLAQFVAGILEYQRKNTFATVAFCCFGGFWMSIAIQGTLVIAKVYPKQTVGGEQYMLCLWGLLTFMLWLCTFNMNLVTSALFLSLSLLFFFIAGGQQNTACLKFAGCWGIMVSCIAFYGATSMLMEEVYGRVILPLFPFGAVNKRTAGHIGTMRRTDLPAYDAEKAAHP